MNSPALLLALAPAASAVTNCMVSATQNAGAAFASMLQNVQGEQATHGATAQHETKPTLTDAVQSLAEEMREWLRSKGAGSDYSLDYHLTADGESQMTVEGAAADEVQELLASDRSWLAKLRQLASSLQAESAERHQETNATAVSIEIDPQSARLRS